MTTTEHTFEVSGNAQISTTQMALGFPDPAGLTFKERKALNIAKGKFQKPSTTLENCYGKVLRIAGFIQHPASVTDMVTGEVRDVTRTVFLLENGDCVSSTSQAVDRYCQQLLTDLGPLTLGMFEEPVSVHVLPQKTKRGQTTYSLSMVED